MAVDHKRALAAYEIGAEGGNALCQYELGVMLMNGQGIDSPDYEQARVWYEKAAAQDDPYAFTGLGAMASKGQAQTPSLRRAREHFQRAIGLGHAHAVTNMQMLTQTIANVNQSHSP